MIYDISNYQKGLDLKELEDLEGVIIRIGWGDDLSDQMIQRLLTSLSSAESLACLMAFIFSAMRLMRARVPTSSSSTETQR